MQSTVTTRLFHAAPARARASILRYGLDHSRSRAAAKFMQAGPEFDGGTRPLGSYLYADEYAARSFADRNIKGAFDVWAVRSDCLQLQRDPEPVGDAWYSEQPIQPSALEGIAFSTDQQIPYTPGELHRPS